MKMLKFQLFQLFLIIFNYLFIKSFSNNNYNLCGEVISQINQVSFTYLLKQSNKICYSFIPINFYLCKELLKQSKECNGLIYYNSRCTLYRRNNLINNENKSLIYQQKNKNKEFISYFHYILLDKEFDNCIEGEIKKKHFMKECLDENNLNDMNDMNSLKDWLKLPSLGIVMAVTNEWIERNQFEISRIIDHWSCYANTHNYTFVSYFKYFFFSFFLLIN